MRNIITISVPPSLKKDVENIMKEDKYASISELFRDAMRSLEEERLFQSVLRSRRDFNEGRFKRLGSLKELM